MARLNQNALTLHRRAASRRWMLRRIQDMPRPVARTDLYDA